jgi:glutamate--cysteine ligase
VRVAGHCDPRLDRLRALAFAPRPIGAPRRIGAEIEWIPIDPATRRVLPVATSVAMLRAAGRGEWCEEMTPSGAPRFVLADRSALSFEPGGQIEYSSPPSTSASEVVARMRAVVARLSEFTLLTVGLDPVNPPEHAPLQLGGARYCGMDAYFRTIGPAGARMMRQTAAYQVSLDRGADPGAEWRLLNALAPYAVATFANSPRYAGADTGHQSYRAHTWRTLDPTRTGVFRGGDGDPAAEYLAFALRARTILDPSHAPFGELALGDAAWETHLTTLFPEVRPRGTFELRSADAVDPSWYAAPLAWLGGLVYDPVTARAAADLVGEADADRLVRAGVAGLKDPLIAAVACDLSDLAADGCRRLGPAFIDPVELEQTSDLFDRYTRRGRSPADDTRSVTAPS